MKMTKMDIVKLMDETSVNWKLTTNTMRIYWFAFMEPGRNQRLLALNSAKYGHNLMSPNKTYCLLQTVVYK